MFLWKLKRQKQQIFTGVKALFLAKPLCVPECASGKNSHDRTLLSDDVFAFRVRRGVLRDGQGSSGERLFSMQNRFRAGWPPESDESFPRCVPSFCLFISILLSAYKSSCAAVSACKKFGERCCWCIARVLLCKMKGRKRRGCRLADVARWETSEREMHPFHQIDLTWPTASHFYSLRIS